MSRFALVVSDVDGTLVTHDKVLTPRAIAAVLRLQLPFGGYNGGAIVMPDLSVVERQLIPVEAARTAVATFRQYRIDPWLFVGNEWVVTNPSGDHVEHEAHTVQTPPTVVADFTAAHFAGAGKIVGPSRDHALVAQVTELLQGALAGSASVARSQPYYCDVTPPGIDKGRLIDLLAARLAVPHPAILVLGDMENDLEMFRKAGFGVAMGNAAAAVKAAAQATTLSNDEDGFAAAVERYVLG